MRTQYDLLKGLYFDDKIEKDRCSIYKSDIITDNFWNIATLNIENAFDDVSILTDIEQQFEKISRKPCIYIPRTMDNYDNHKSYLVNNGYKVNDTDAYMVFVGSNNHVEIIDDIEKVDTNKQYNDFMEVMESAYSGEITKDNPYAGSITNEYYEAIKKSLGNNHFHHYILYKDGQPASIATLSCNNGHAVINNVGTKKEYQNIGLGKQIIKYCIDESKKLGSETLFLFTEYKSKNEQWYAKQGFKTIFVNEQYLKNI